MKKRNFEEIYKLNLSSRSDYNIADAVIGRRLTSKVLGIILRHLC